MAKHRFTRRHRWEAHATIGFLGATKQSAWSEFIAPFEHRLRELGWTYGHNLDIDYRWADGQENRYRPIARSFVNRHVDVIVTAGTSAVHAAKQTTKSIPIVFAAAGDPVRTGLVRSMAHPGGNVTGLSNGQTDLAGKRLDMLRQIVPDLHTLAVIGNRASHNVRLEMDRLQKRARRHGIGTIIVDIRHAPQIAPSIKRLKGKADALYVCTDPFVTHNAVSINTLAMSIGLPTMQAFRHQVEGGGLISYGPDFRDMFGDSADLVDKILRGESPADIPVRLGDKRELVINVHTAKALGLTIPKGLRRRALLIR
jgi:putative ABC transport system substrate-binding protein